MYNGKYVTLCIPTLTRYDMLEKCINSAEAGTLPPDFYMVVDNGGGVEVRNPRIHVFKPGMNMGVAGSWNFFIRNAPEIRIISNDDISFLPDAVERMVKECGDDMCCPQNMTGNAYSIFILPNNIIDKVGYFDQEISPGWAYFEDNDFSYRMSLLGLSMHATSAEVEHFGSATLKSLTPEQTRAHHQKFEIAKANYFRKWGGLPGKEKFTTPFNK